jgi:hypothetical protein
MKPEGLLIFRVGGRCLLKKINLRTKPGRQRQGVVDTPEITGGWTDRDQDFFLIHGRLSPHHRPTKKYAND